jgi:hypothetical protein
MSRAKPLSAKGVHTKKEMHANKQDDKACKNIKMCTKISSRGKECWQRVKGERQPRANMLQNASQRVSICNNRAWPARGRLAQSSISSDDGLKQAQYGTESVA